MAGMYYGKDGGWYDNIGDKMAADTRYDQQEKQNNLLAQQNKLLQQQIEEKVNLERELKAKQLENDKEIAMIERDTQLELQEKQMKHDKEMRLLKLFDDAGINKNDYTTFLDNLFGRDIKKAIDDLEEMKSKKREKEKILENINKYYKNPKDGFKYIKDLFTEYDPEILLKSKENLNNYLKNPKNRKLTLIIENFLNKVNTKEYQEAKKKEKKRSRKKIISGTIFLSLCPFPPFILMDIADRINANEDTFALIGSIISLIFVIKGIYDFAKTSYNTKFMIPLIEKEIKNIDKQIEDPVGYYELEESIYETKASNEKILLMIDDYIKTNEKLNNEVVKPNWNDFVEFRKKHYNSKIENLLIETGLQETILSLGLKYPKINANNKTGDGTIEDYIAYFDEFNEN